MTSRARLILQNLLCAICFLLDFRTGVFGASGLLVVAFVVSAALEAFRSRRFSTVLVKSASYLLWVAATIVCGMTSSTLAKEQATKIIDIATTYKAKTGRYPQSLDELPEYAGSLDGQLNWHIGSSRVFLYGGSVTYLKFPGRWVNYDLETKRQVESDVW